jgi:hypothetical protein
MLTTIRTRVQARRERHAARDRYDKHANFYGKLLSATDYTNRSIRISNLSMLVYTAHEMAKECRTFDNKRFDNNGFTPEQWHRHEASLFLLVLAAEEHDFSEVELDEVAHELWLEPAISSILGDMSLLDDRDLKHKAHLLLRLCDEAAPHVGGQAVETIAALAHVYYTSAGLTNKEAHALVWGKQAA